MRGRSLALLLVAGALVVQLLSALGAMLIFDRVAIDAGEYWRVVSGSSSPAGCWRLVPR